MEIQPWFKDERPVNLTVYRDSLARCPPGREEAVFRAVADAFEDDLLECDTFPRDYFEFALDLLSDPQLYQKPGVWNFLLVLGSEKQKMLPSHYSEVASRILRSYKGYTDPDLCLAACDFIARNYPCQTAKSMLADLGSIEIEKSEELRGFVSDGLKILAFTGSAELGRWGSTDK